jgi:hypothetical protein
MRAFVYASSVASFLVFSYKRVESYNVGWRQLQWLSAPEAYSRGVLDTSTAPERCSGNSLPRHRRIAMGVLVGNDDRCLAAVPRSETRSTTTVTSAFSSRLGALQQWFAMQ